MDVLVEGSGALEPPSTVRDGPGATDVDGTTSTTTLTANWDPVSHEDFASYDNCFSTSSTGADCATTATAPTPTSFSTTDDGAP